MNELQKPIVVVVAGGTASGKTTLVNAVINSFAPEETVSLPIDAYYRSQDHKTFKEREVQNYDHPDSIEFPLFIEQLKELINRNSIYAPQYDFTTHTRKNETTLVTPAPVVIVDGILALHSEELRELSDLDIFVRTPEEVRLQRRVQRDTQERGRTHESVLEQWQKTVKPMHDQFCEPSSEFADLIVDGTEDVTESVGEIHQRIARLRKSF